MWPIWLRYADRPCPASTLSWIYFNNIIKFEYCCHPLIPTKFRNHVNLASKILTVDWWDGMANQQGFRPIYTSHASQYLFCMNTIKESAWFGSTRILQNIHVVSSCHKGLDVWNEARLAMKNISTLWVCVMQFMSHVRSYPEQDKTSVALHTFSVDFTTSAYKSNKY